MLVLSRKQKQQIKIGNDVVVTVLQIKGGSVRLGIEAPREVHVMRGELDDFTKSTETVPPNAVPKPVAANQETSNAEDRTILELKFHGAGSDDSSTNSLADIVNALPAVNLPR